MKLSEAIREGSKIRPPVFGHYFQPIETFEKDLMGSCAIGAAYEAISGRYEFPLGKAMEDYVYTFVKQNIDISMLPLNYKFMYPIGDEKEKVIVSISDILTDVIFANDINKSSRDDIANWLEKQGL